MSVRSIWHHVGWCPRLHGMSVSDTGMTHVCQTPQNVRISQLMTIFFIAASVLSAFMANFFPKWLIMTTAIALAMTLLCIASYIVSCHCTPRVELLANTGLLNWYKSLLPNTIPDSGKQRFARSNSAVISGFAAKLTKAKLCAKKALDGSVFVQLDEHCDIGTTNAPEFLGLNTSVQ